MFVDFISILNDFLSRRTETCIGIHIAAHSACVKQPSSSFDGLDNRDLDSRNVDKCGRRGYRLATEYDSHALIFDGFALLIHRICDGNSRIAMNFLMFQGAAV